MIHSSRRSPRRSWSTRLLVEELESRSLLAAPGPGQAVLPVQPSDPLYSQEYGLAKIQAGQAWTIARGNTSVIVADIDSGIDYTHPDLYLNVWINQTEVPAAKTGLQDTNGNSRVDFYDLNSLDSQFNVVYAADGFTPINVTFSFDRGDDSNNYIEAGDLLADSTWADGAFGPGNNLLDDIVGWDFINNDNNPLDTLGHGTHTAGTIGAIGNNGVGVAGVNWQVSIMALQVGPTSDNSLFKNAAVQAVYYAVDNGARVSNNSWILYGGQNNVSDPLYAAIKYAGERNHLFVAAAGNDGLNNDSAANRAYPASYTLSNIISVTATDGQDRRPPWANYGKTSVDLSAPGLNILSTVPTSVHPSGYDYYTGTSMAAPHVAGTAALLLAKNPGLSAAQLKSAILNSVDRVSALSQKTVTGGRLNAFKALQSVPQAAAAIGPMESAAISSADAKGAPSFASLIPDDLSATGNPSVADATPATTPVLVKIDAALFLLPASQGTAFRMEILAPLPPRTFHDEVAARLKDNPLSTGVSSSLPWQTEYLIAAGQSIEEATEAGDNGRVEGERYSSPDRVDTFSPAELNEMPSAMEAAHAQAFMEPDWCETTPDLLILPPSETGEADTYDFADAAWAVGLVVSGLGMVSLRPSAQTASPRRGRPQLATA